MDGCSEDAEPSKKINTMQVRNCRMEGTESAERVGTKASAWAYIFVQCGEDLRATDWASSSFETCGEDCCCPRPACLLLAV